MLLKQVLAIVAVAVLPLAANGQAKQSSPDPTEPNAPAVQLQYESAFKNYRSVTDAADAPDMVWRAANDAVGQQGGHDAHAGHAGVPQQANGTDGPKQLAPNSTAKGKAAAAEPESEPVDHSKHHHH